MAVEGGRLHANTPHLLTLKWGPHTDETAKLFYGHGPYPGLRDMVLAQPVQCGKPWATTTYST